MGEVEFDPFASPYRPATPNRQTVPAAAPEQRELSAPRSAQQQQPPVASEDDGDDVAACDVGPSDFKSRVALFERDLLARSLAEHRFNQRATAEALGLTYDQLRHALRRHDLIGSS